ncbi:zf-HC2 domain-containing protein [Blastococcus sp. CT_GayMR20]|uniref:anti-sigma factor family protein n=1 Tax=Blastococcus sp. CT_GayMR20 TaxID=2559609 RepID=UPI001074213F|nr:anti-sigma factor [Blastococcus sp. CT_GayMR20]TFV91632.1 zf-HC2 domain-containing protein [Blastococcus sp. CT_GayMR20]
MSIPESHLAQEAIAALVDGELAAGPATRAARHLAGCVQCRLAVEAQREAKEALHESRDVAVPGDLMSRLCAIPFTTDVPGSGGGTLAAGPGGLTVTGSSGSWSVDLQPQERPQRPDHARWLRRGLAGTLIGLGAGVTALALNLPADHVPGTTRPPATPVADSSPDRHTEVVPPVVRTLSVGTRSATPGQGGTP